MRSRSRESFWSRGRSGISRTRFEVREQSQRNEVRETQEVRDMSDFQASTTFNEKMRRIRFRRNREKTRFRDELRIIPSWLIVTLIVLFRRRPGGFLSPISGFTP